MEKSSGCRNWQPLSKRVGFSRTCGLGVSGHFLVDMILHEIAVLMFVESHGSSWCFLKEWRDRALRFSSWKNEVNPSELVLLFLVSSGHHGVSIERVSVTSVYPKRSALCFFMGGSRESILWAFYYRDDFLRPCGYLT